MFIDRISTFFDTRLSDKLLNEQFSPDENLVIQKRSELKTVINELFELLNLFIISGEYVDSKLTNRIINLVDNKLNYLINNYEDDDPEAQDFMFSFFFNPLKYSLNSLKVIKVLIENKTSRGNRKIILQGHKKFSISKQQDIFGFANHISFLEINCKIAQIDHNLAVNDKQLENLLIYIIELSENHSANPLNKILQDKCKLLCSKISQRFKGDNKSYLYSFEFQDNEINDLENEITIFTEFKKQYKSHYFEDNINHRKSNVNELYKSTRNDGYNLLKFHSFIKSYKDDNHSLLQIDNLIEEFDSLFDEMISSPSCEYDKRSWEICKNYLYNNKLSLQLEQFPNKIEEHFNLLNEIKKVQDETNVRNYFPFLQFLKNLKSLLSKELHSIDPNFNLIEAVIKYYDVLIKDLYLSFEWCNDNHFQAYSLDKKLCQITKQVESIGSIKLFVASSFILPLNYKEVKIEIDNINDSFNEFKNHIPLFIRLLDEGIKIENTEKEIERRDRNQIEILGIFAAIVLFAAGGINIFKESPSIQESAKYSLIFSYSLGLFVILIWLVTRDKVQFKPSLAHVFIAIFFLICTCLIFSLSFNFWPFN